MRILIIDRQSQACRCLKDLLEKWPQISALREAANGCEALHLLEDYQPEIFLADVRTPDLNGLNAIQLIKAKYHSFVVIDLAMEPELKAEALTSGADAFISKSDPPEKLMEVLAYVLCENNKQEREHLQPLKGLPPKVPRQTLKPASKRPG
jgi:DNA-binding NarL/FixJ family response regulator